jgi:hypothetical protein
MLRRAVDRLEQRPGAPESSIANPKAPSALAAVIVPPETLDISAKTGIVELRPSDAPAPSSVRTLLPKVHIRARSSTARDQYQPASTLNIFLFPKEAFGIRVGTLFETKVPSPSSPLPQYPTESENKI